MRRFSCSMLLFLFRDCCIEWPPLARTMSLNKMCLLLVWLRSLIPDCLSLADALVSLFRPRNEICTFFSMLWIFSKRRWLSSSSCLSLYFSFTDCRLRGGSFAREFSVGRLTLWLYEILGEPCSDRSVEWICLYPPFLVDTLSYSICAIIRMFS